VDVPKTLIAPQHSVTRPSQAAESLLLRAHRRQREFAIVQTLGGEVVGEYSLNEPELLAGRDHRADIPLFSTLASRRHARLYFRRGEYLIEDLLSINGVFLNGLRIHSALLRDGDVILLGDDCLIFGER
jgi:pSer/pThr/pTyr-binding forkhead associated (FHA) protein